MSQSLGSCAAWACPHRDVSGPLSAPSGQVLTQMWPSPDADVWASPAADVGQVLTPADEAAASFLLAPLQIARSLEASRTRGRTAPSALRQAATGYVGASVLVQWLVANAEHSGERK